MEGTNAALPPAPAGYTAQASDGVPKPEIVYSAQPQPVYSQQPTYVTPLERLRDQSEYVDCPFCHKVTKTTVVKNDSNTTMIAGAVLCLVCICLTCLPCILGWAQNTDHSCLSCGKQLTHQAYDGMTAVTPAAKDAQRKMAGGEPLPGPMPGQVASSFPSRQEETDQSPAQAPQDTQ